MKLKTSLRKISILRFYFSVSFTPNWTLVKIFTQRVAAELPSHNIDATGAAEVVADASRIWTLCHFQ